MDVSLLISKALGYAIITGSLIVKVPQIINILKAGNAQGLELSMFLLEMIGYAIPPTFSTLAHELANAQLHHQHVLLDLEEQPVQHLRRELVHCFPE
jgi:hypothetical protein